MTDFQTDKQTLLNDLADARDELLRTVRPLTPEDLARARRGGWTVARILQHVIQSERLYAQAIAALVGAAAPVIDKTGEPQSIAETIAALEATRAAALHALEHASEDNFYEIKQLGHEEYSVLSVIENVANHDREHSEQIRKTLGEV